MTTPAIPVAEFRRRVDHLARVVNVDYHACVGAHELRVWVSIADRLAAEVEQLVCKRATADDLSWRDRVMALATERRASGLERIAAAERAAAQVIKQFGHQSDEQRSGKVQLNELLTATAATIIPFPRAGQAAPAIH